jgi:hypothetical protein
VFYEQFLLEGKNLHVHLALWFPIPDQLATAHSAPGKIHLLYHACASEILL